MRARARALGATAISSNERGAGEEDGSRAEDVGARARARTVPRGWCGRTSERVGYGGAGRARIGGVCGAGCAHAPRSRPAGRFSAGRRARGRGAPVCRGAYVRLGSVRRGRSVALRERRSRLRPGMEKRDTAKLYRKYLRAFTTFSGLHNITSEL
ncbi:hypothetical protein GUJ93_ZPchr0458g22782 [Zizania palustris]|uniref:Uncharacterized protein n=1 Tax=Zizania palustris TaxID=103762 RepID=A0A8J5V2N7_ZIZPA|nr:hypothetical protein GUJ93_ZPchr0458g22782 [Zizania palustris]